MRLAKRALPALLCALMTAGAAQAQELDRLIPDTTVFYVSIENLDRTRERFEQSPLKAFWEDADVQKFLEKPLRKWSEMMEEDKESSGINVEEILEVVSGRLAFAVTGIDAAAGGLDESDVHLVMLAEIGDNTDKVREMIEDRERIRLEDGKQRRFEEEFGDVTIVYYRSVEEAEEGGEEQDDSVIDAWFLDGSTFAKSDTVEDLQKLLAMREETDTPRLADSELYRATRARTGESGDLFVYFGVPAMLQAIEEGVVADEAAGGGAAQQGPTMEAIFGALGLHGVKAMAMQSRLGREGVVNNMFIAAPGAKEGLLKFFDAKNSALLPPPWVPEDAISATTMTLDMQAIWQEIRRAAEKIQPGADQMIDMYMEQIKAGTGIDLQADLIGSMGKELTWYVRASDNAGIAEGEPEVPAAVFAMEITDKSKLEGVLNIAQAMSQGMMQMEDYLGMRIRTIATPMGVSPAIALLPDQLIFAMNVEDLKDILNRFGKDVKGMRDLPEFARYMEYLPASRMYLNLNREAKALRQSFMMNSIQMSPEMREIFDVSLFPSEEVLEKYLDVGLAAMANEEDGIYYTYFVAFKKEGGEEEVEEAVEEGDG